MNRREFLFNAAAGLFVAASPKIIVDLAANTWRRPTLVVTVSGFIGGAFDIITQYDKARYEMRVNARNFCRTPLALVYVAESLARSHNRHLDRHGLSHPKLTNEDICLALTCDDCYSIPPRPISFGEASSLYPTDT